LRSKEAEAHQEDVETADKESVRVKDQGQIGYKQPTQRECKVGGYRGRKEGKLMQMQEKDWRQLGRVEMEGSA